MRQLRNIGRQNSLWSTFAFKIAMVISIYQTTKRKEFDETYVGDEYGLD